MNIRSLNILAAVTFVSSLCAHNSAVQPIALQPEIIRIIDGSSLGVRGYEVKLMLQIILKIDSMLKGDADTRGTTTGHYTYAGKKYCVQKLAEIEADVEKEWLDYTKAHHAHDAQYTHHEKNYHHAKALLKRALDEAREDFDQKVSSFMSNAHGAKPQLLMLMQQSCKGHHRPDSFLLTWGKAEEGHEKDALYHDITTFKAFELFCNDLKNFMKDMIFSCPKAVAQYKEMRAQFAANHK